jgi:hypothetical protein
MKLSIFSKSIFILIIAGTLPFFSGCHSNKSNQSSSPQQPGTSAPDASAALLKKCDSQREELRKIAMASLGISALQAESDKVMKQLTPDDRNKIVKDAIEASEPGTSTEVSENDESEIASTISAAAGEAGLSSTSPTVIPDTNPVRVIDIGKPEYVDGGGNFTVGGAHLQSTKGIKVDDIYVVYLGVGLDSQSPNDSFQNYSIGLGQVTDASHATYTIVLLSDYVQKLLPSFCPRPTSVDYLQAFNTLAVGASPTN